MRSNAIVSAVVLVAFAADARAEPPESRSWFKEQMAAPTGALELTVGSGYTQGIGMLRGSTSLPSIASAGVAVDVGAGARISERLSVALVGQVHELIAERGSALQELPSVRGMTGGIAMTYHLAPEVRFDPWIEIGTGYRVLWQTRTELRPAAIAHGPSLVRMRIGADFRVVHEIALGPMIGADANIFLWEDVVTSRAIDDVRLSTFVFAGVQGRIDIGGTLTSRTAVTSADFESSR